MINYPKREVLLAGIATVMLTIVAVIAVTGAVYAFDRRHVLGHMDAQPMVCTYYRTTGLKRCENSEAICYYSNDAGGPSCRFKIFPSLVWEK